MLDEKTKKRIQRLHAMANDAASENEAMIAARRLQLLLAKHGLSELDIDSPDEPSIDSDSIHVDKKTGGPWAGRIALAVAELYFCKVHKIPTGTVAQHLVISGSEAYRQTAITMVKAVINIVDTEARVSSKTDRPKGQDGWAYICSFRTAAAQRIAIRCRHLINQARRGELQDDDGSTLPVLASLYDKEARAVEQFLAHLGLRASRSRSSVTSREGAAQGDACGRRVSLGREIGRHAPKALGRS